MNNPGNHENISVIKIQSIVRGFLLRRLFKTAIGNYKLICDEIESFVSHSNNIKYQLDTMGRFVLIQYFLLYYE